MKKLILLFIFLFSFGICFSQNSNVTNTIEIYNSDSASIWKFYKTKLPQAGYKNLYIQLIGVNQGYNFDTGYGNVYRLNFQTNNFFDNYHNRFLGNSWMINIWGGIDVGYTYDFNISPKDTNLILKGGCAAWWEPSDGVQLTFNNGDSLKTAFPNSFQPFFITVAIDPINDSIMYAGLKSSSAPENFFKTTNRGANWFVTDTITNYVESRTYVNPFSRNIIFLMNSNLYWSTTGGYDFSINSTGTNYDGKMVFDTTDNTIYLISPTGFGIRKSTNNGNSWIQVFNIPSNDLEIDPLNQNIFYAGTPEGIYKSTNKGVGWFLYNNAFSPSKNVIGLVKNPNMADTIYAVTSKSVYKVFGQALVDTSSPKYFPLAVGNVYVYSWIYNGFPSGGGVYRIRIIKDTIINNKKYYKTNGNFPTVYGNSYLYRYDSLSGNIYNFIGINGCGYNPTERLLDSIRAKKYDTALTCNSSNIFDRKCYDTTSQTVFGIYTPTKSFDNLIMLTATARKYGKNFGIINAAEGDPYVTSHSLQGCVINGIVYGDTTAPPDVYTISGTVRYSDNNQPVTSGMVKAFKLEKITSNIIIFDSAIIQSNGSYTLPNVPQDSVDIGVFPNSTPPNDYVITYYPSTVYWEHALVLYPTGNLTNIDIGAIRMSATENSNSVNGKVMRLTDNPLDNLKDAVLYAKSGNTFVRCAVSDGNGVYHLNSLPTGNLKILATRLGFSRDSVNVNVTSTSNIDSINFQLHYLFTGIKQINSTIPSEYKLYQNYPNPFNPTTNIKYQITNNKLVVLKIYDILGKEVVTLVNEKQKPGVYEVTFNASTLPSGIYFYKLVAGEFVETKKMVLIK